MADQGELVVAQRLRDPDDVRRNDDGSWDIAAGVLLVTEAGGIVTAFDGSDIDVTAPSGVVAATPALHSTVLEGIIG